MDSYTEEIQVSETQLCHDWPLGQCSHGENCVRWHPENLNPGSVTTREHPDYMVPNGVGEACQRCLQSARACDKKGRGGQDDPCSECRWFGGDSCRCLIAPTSYNDQLWAVMMTRGDYDFTLPAPKSREVGKPNKAPPAPMSLAKLKSDWQGETREALMAKPDMLPPFVREHPRAYLVPPRPSAKDQRSAKHRDINGKRKRESPAVPPESSLVPSLPPFPAPLQFPQPPADPLHGEVVSTSWSWNLKRWEHQYADGLLVLEPPSATQRSADMGSGRSTIPVRGQNTARGHADRQQQQQPPLKRSRVESSFAGSANVTPQTAQTQSGVEAQQQPPAMEVDSGFPPLRIGGDEEDSDGYHSDSN